MNFVDILHPSCALFLDFDGSLVDLAPQPEAVVVPSGLVATLESLKNYLGGALALVSGRPIEQIDAFLRPLQLPAAGVHGAERRAADGAVTLMSTHPLDEVEAAALALAARLHEPASGRTLEIYTTEPGLQVYSGQALGGVVGKGVTYPVFAGVALETQHFPDSPNQASFPNTILRPGDGFTSRTVYRFSVS